MTIDLFASKGNTFARPLCLEHRGRRRVCAFARVHYSLSRCFRWCSSLIAYEVGTYDASWDEPKNRSRGQGSGNYVTVWKKVGGEWKKAAYIWNGGEEK